MQEIPKNVLTIPLKSKIQKHINLNAMGNLQEIFIFNDYTL